jgi:signal transduction histidine kinase
MDPITADVLHGAVHDLKGPAHRLRMLTQLLSRECTAFDEDTRQLLRHVQDSAAAVGMVAEGLRHYAEICARPLNLEPLELGHTLAAGIACLQTEIARAGAEVTFSGLPAASADRFLITWLFQELLANALRFRASDASLRVHVSSGSGGPGGWFVSVADNGPGIEAGMAERVFLPFKKLAPGGAAGLGLTICRRIVEMHAGRMWVEPREGGAEFRFFLGNASAKNECL